MKKGYTKNDFNVAIVGGGIIGHIMGTALHAEGHNVILFDGQEVPGASRACTGLVDLSQCGEEIMLLLHGLYPAFGTKMVKVNDKMCMYGYLDKTEIFRSFPEDRLLRRNVYPVSLKKPVLNLGDCEKEFDLIIFCVGAATNDLLSIYKFKLPAKICPVFTGNLVSRAANDEMITEEKYREYHIRDLAGHARASAVYLNGTHRPFPKVYELDRLKVQDHPCFMNLAPGIWVATGAGTQGIYYAAKWYLQLVNAYKRGVPQHVLVDI